MKLGEICGYITDRLYTTDDFGTAGKLKDRIAKVEGYNPKLAIFSIKILIEMALLTMEKIQKSNLAILAL